TWWGKTPPTAPAAMPAPVTLKNDRRDHLPCRMRLPPSYVMSVSSEVIGFFLESAQQPRRACGGLRMSRGYYSAGVRPIVKRSIVPRKPAIRVFGDKGQETPGDWWGTSSSAFGLSGKVAR